LETQRKSGRKASSTESGAPTLRSVSVRRRKKRGTSLDAEIKAAAKQIVATQMVEAYKAAALSIVGKKLDEIRAILNAAGFQPAVGSPVYAAPSPQAVARPAQPTGPLCAICGNAAVRRAKPNRFTIGAPAWYCRVHESLAGQIEAEDRLDNAIIGAQAPIQKPKPVLQVTNAPAQMVPQNEAPVEAAPQEDALGAAMAAAALGVEGDA
jgi:hypothetical protein